jgi:hypothetical protein
MAGEDGVGGRHRVSCLHGEGVSWHGGFPGDDGVGLDGDGAELRAGWAGGAQEDFHTRGRARMAGAGVTRITMAVSRVRTAEAEQGCGRLQ